MKNLVFFRGFFCGAPAGNGGRMTADQLQLVTLENILLNQPYNDLGILAEDRLLILVEAQSTWSENNLVRVFIYLAQTFQNYITETQQDIYGRKRRTVS